MQLTYRIAFMVITSLVKAGSPVHSVLMIGDNFASTHCNTLLTHVVYAAQSVFYFFWYNTAPTEESRTWMDYFLELIRLLTTVLDCHASQHDCDVVNAYAHVLDVEPLLQVLVTSAQQPNTLRNIAIAAVKRHTSARGLRRNLSTLGLPRALTAAVCLDDVRGLRKVDHPAFVSW